MAVARLNHRVAVRTETQDVSAFASIGVGLLLVFLYVAYSRVTDVFLPNLSLALVISIPTLLVAILTGGLQRALGSRAGLWLSLFTIWLVIATPFSFWRGGSVETLTNVWLKSFLVFVLVAGLLRTVGHCRRAMYTIAAATITIAVMCLVIGTRSTEGRLILDRGVLSNPNDLAQMLLIGAPFLLLVAMSRQRFAVTRALAGGWIVAVLLATGATGSRGALTAFACLTLLMFVSLSWANKAKLMLALVICVPLVVTSMNAEQRERYLTIFGGDPGAGDEAAVIEAAVSSRTQRLLLLGQSIGITFEHPLLGVGPGVYQAAVAAQDDTNTQVSAWRETHNAYTQVSAEAGLPAFVFFVLALIVSMRNTRAIYREARARDMDVVANTAYCLWLSFISFAVTAAFSSVAYQIYLPTLAGLGVALGRAVQTDFDAASSTKAA